MAEPPHRLSATDSSANRQLQTSADVLETSKSLLSACPSERYVVVTQPGAHASDMRGVSSAVVLRQAVSRSGVQTGLDVAEVYGMLEDDYFAGMIEQACQEVGRK